MKQYSNPIKSAPSATRDAKPSSFLQRHNGRDNLGAGTQNSLQRKLAIGASNDPQEHEADRIADQVLAAPARTEVGASGPRIRRNGGAASEKGDSAPASVERVLAGSGRPLDPVLGQDMAQRFGHDFSRVRVHTDGAAALSAREINANAYTAGYNIVFGADQFAPNTHQGRRLIAHELTHVVQQSGQDSIQLKPAAPAPATGGLTKDMLIKIARTLREAMQGLGTDEESIYAAFSGRTQEQVDAISQTYREVYGVDLSADLRDELSDSELAKLAALAPNAAPGKAGSPQQAAAFADQIAHQLDQAMDRLGTDEAAIFAALGGRTPAELQAIREAYQRLTKRDLEADIRDEMSGSDLTHALDLLNQGEAVAKLHLFADIDVKDLGFTDLARGNVGHTWVSLQYTDPKKVPAKTHPVHKPLLEAGGVFADPMGFWPAIHEGIFFSVNPFNSWVKGWMSHPDRAHESSVKATETWDIASPAVDMVINYAESKRKAQYSVYSYNCTTFAKEAVEAAGKRPPSMTSLGFAMPNAAYDGIKKRQSKGIGNTSVKDFDTKIETVVNKPDASHDDKKN